ncbi:DeoR/GlpR family DNA-binding transcription regulator [Paenibacillus sp. OV219]|uniref:DeoR/GlpR family DNA-binding transcription regulator n=1 Tax=Paenibacillus sp. OV219 TaxID=1884377 RepID=UPI0008BD9181|nr:DeoR/GlpR family DNA-binding transcription regulator [Paenibacillus sp. OV219]SEO03509.1 transcriptional regulator, DeoR family [Paenibacillus sp. OV219]
MLAEERRQRILEILAKDGRVIAQELAQQFQLSIDSIRRDLSIMKDQGLLRKTYGGAVPVYDTPSRKVRDKPQPKNIRYGDGAPHQNAISQLAASYIQPNDTVFIGGAGIQFGMLKYLKAEMPFTVVTNSLTIAETLRLMPQVEAYLVGGKLRPGGDTMIDTIAQEMIGRFNYDIGFITGGGISQKGITVATPENAALIRAAAEASNRRICLAPHEKLGVRSFATSVPLQLIDILITDQGAPEHLIQDFENHNINVIIADENLASGGADDESH